MSILQKKTKEFESIKTLRSAPLAEQRAAGYADTLREILQQPQTWQGTAEHIAQPAAREPFARALQPRPTHIVLTGSGSSMYIGESLAPTLQAELGISTQAIAAGTLLTHLRGTLPPGPGLLVSFARSGDSPESCGVVSRILEEASDWRHLVITCNAQGKLATLYRDEPRVDVVVLDERTNDRSLVMTSSFSNLLLAGTGLLQAGQGAIPATALPSLVEAVQQVFDHHGEAIAGMARRDFDAAVYLGSGGGIGIAREAALKMLEMTGGKVITLAETFLGLRHGPMSSVHPKTLIVAFLSSDPVVRGYEADLLRELSRKQLGLARLIVGEGIPADLVGVDDVAIDLRGVAGHGEVPTLLAEVVAGQLLAFFRCLHLGDKPDTPSQGVLTRVVEDFAIHGAG
ncbi:tagatose-6-phosphate ketose isomerase [Dyella sp.]|uniref:SIS domain-containing protein n=1 Tax=Dyella sp. TaxID=1869338 RepID=UPI002ED250C4